MDITIPDSVLHEKPNYWRHALRGTDEYNAVVTRIDYVCNVVLRGNVGAPAHDFIHNLAHGSLSFPEVYRDSWGDMESMFLGEMRREAALWKACDLNLPVDCIDAKNVRLAVDEMCERKSIAAETNNSGTARVHMSAGEKVVALPVPTVERKQDVRSLGFLERIFLFFKNMVRFFSLW